MKYKAKLISPDGTVRSVEPRNGTNFTYEELVEFMDGGYVEVIRPPGNTGAIMVVDEEGKCKGLPFNPLATRMWQEGCDPGSPREYDAVVGPALLCHDSQIK